jgi:hypothetical protein
LALILAVVEGMSLEARHLHRLLLHSTRKGAQIMPREKPLKGVGEKEARMYEHIKDEAKQDHRYGKRAEEVAARTVLKHHREEHHKTGQ